MCETVHRKKMHSHKELHTTELTKNCGLAELDTSSRGLMGILTIHYIVLDVRNGSQKNDLQNDTRA